MATLVYSDVDGIDRSFALGNEPITVGRAPECAIRSEDPRVSRVHARFFVEGGVLWVEDLNSANGIFVGPQRVARAPVPTGEIILVGSLMIRLLPASGTLPPPVGLHGTLATWLGMERKARTAVEDERDAFAKRVGELHQQIARMPPPGDPEAIRLRDEAVARAAALENALAAIQDELGTMRGRAGTADQTRGALDEALAAQSNAEQAHVESVRDAQTVRDELDKLRKSSQLELELLRVELAKVREAKNVAETQAGMLVAEKLADADFKIADLERQVAKQAQAQGGPDPKLQQLSEAVTTLTSRAEKAEKELASVSIRAQGAERNLSGATAQAAKAEAHAAQLETRAKEAEATLAMREADMAATRARAEELEMTVVPGIAGVEVAKKAEARAAQLSDELTELTSQFETRRDRLVELETTIAAQSEAAKQAEAAATAARAEATATAVKLAETEKRAAELKARLDQLSGADSQIAVATKSKDDALARATTNEQRAASAEKRADDAEKRAGAADTMAKAMAKDVAEALRRAAEADSKAKANVRELAEIRGKSDEFDKTLVAAGTARTQAEERAKHADSELLRVQKELGEQLAKAEQELAEHVSDTQRELAARAEQTQRDLRTRVEDVQREMAAKLEQLTREMTAKLEARERELAAERSSSLALVDRKTQLEREVGETRRFGERAEAAETRVVELEVQLEQLQERADDLESGLAVAETSRQATVDDERTKTKQLERKLVTADRAIADANETIESMRARLSTLESQLRETDQAHGTAEEALREARVQLTEAIRASEEHRGFSEAERDKLDDALARAEQAESRIEGLSRSAEAADLAIGRAGALQRQLDEAIAKLTWMERDLSSAKGSKSAEQTEALEKLAIAEKQARVAEDRVRDSSAKLGDVDRQAREAASRVQALEAELQRQAGESRATESRFGEFEKKLTDAERRNTAAEQRAVAAEQRAIGAEADAASAGVTSEELDEARERITELEQELSKADNVRSFAAETEREIAGLQRELREVKGNLTRVTLERDRFESELRDSREDSETHNRAVASPSLDIAKFNKMMARASELEKDNAALRNQLKALEARLEEAEEKAESTATGTQLPLGGVAEQVSIIEESIDSLRSNMRAASDETAMMDQSESVVAVASAVSQAAEHIERARAAIKQLVKTFGG